MICTNAIITHNTDDTALVNVFGKHRVATHFPTSSARLTLHDRKLLESDEISLQLACASMKNAAMSEKLLSAQFGANNVHPAYTSTSNDTVCFVTIAEAVVLRQMQSTGLLRSVWMCPCLCCCQCSTYDSEIWFVAVAL